MSDRFDSYADQLTIGTPEQVDLRFPVAGIGSRFLAVLTDHLIQLGVYLAVILAFAVLLPGSSTASKVTEAARNSRAENWAVAMIVLFNFVVLWCYFALFEAYWHGQTPGKRLLNIRVIKDSGRPITLFEALARNLLRAVDLLPSFYLTGVITMLCNRGSKRLGDLVAGTIVIHERVNDAPVMAHGSRTITAGMYTEHRLVERGARSLQGQDFQVPADAVAKLKAADLNVIEIFFSRSLDLSVERRAELASRVAARTTAKMGMELPEGMQPESLLEQVAYRMRSGGRS